MVWLLELYYYVLEIRKLKKSINPFNDKNAEISVSSSRAPVNSDGPVAYRQAKSVQFSNLVNGFVRRYPLKDATLLTHGLLMLIIFVN